MIPLAGGESEVRYFHSNDRHRRSPYLSCSRMDLRSSNRAYFGCRLAPWVSRPESLYERISLMFYKLRTDGWRAIHRRRYRDAAAAAQSALPVGVEY